MTQSHSGRKDFIFFPHTSMSVISERGQGRNSSRNLETVTMERCCVLTSSSHPPPPPPPPSPLVSLLSYIIHDQLLKGDTNPVGWNLTHQLLIRKMLHIHHAPRAICCRQLLVVSFSQVTLVCVKMTKTNQDNIIVLFYYCCRQSPRCLFYKLRVIICLCRKYILSCSHFRHDGGSSLCSLG